MSDQIKYQLVKPLPADGNQKIVDVTLEPLDLKAIWMFGLAVGAKVITSLIKGRDETASDKDKSNMAKALTADGLSSVVEAVLQEDRMVAFNKALASYLDLTVQQVEKLDFVDLIGIWKIVAGFYNKGDDKKKPS